MKIVLVGAYPPPFGGVQVHIMKLKEYLESRGHDCYIINLGKNKRLNAPNIVSPRNAFETAQLLLAHRNGICHLHYGGTLHLRLILLTLFVGFFFKKRCAATIHSGGLPIRGRHTNPIKDLLIRKSFNSMERIICVNSQIARYFRGMEIEKTRVKVVSPFAFYHDYVEDGELPTDVRKFMDGKSNVICNIGLLEPEYDLEMLLRVFQKYRRENPDSGLLMIGSGSLQAKLEGMIQDLHLGDHAILCGDLEHRHTLKILASSSCYVRASKYDGDCISLREAIHLGIPAIASDTGMRPEGALLFPIGNESALLELLGKAIHPDHPASGKARPDLTSLRKIEAILSGLSDPGQSKWA